MRKNIRIPKLSMRQAAVLIGVLHAAGMTTGDKEILLQGKNNVYPRALVNLLRELVAQDEFPVVVQPVTVSIEDEDSVYQDTELLSRFQQAGLTRELAEKIYTAPHNEYAIILMRSFHDEAWRKQAVAEDEARRMRNDEQIYRRLVRKAVTNEPL